MTEQQARFLVEITENQANQEIEIRDSYSGRGMYSKTTYAVVVQDVLTLFCDFATFVNENIEEQDQIGLVWNGGEVPCFNNLRMDNMGHKIVVY